jgi:primosomal protein N' (replication factor Y)
MAKKNNKFILDIVPLTRIPLTRSQSFSYLSDVLLSAGSLVIIPFSGRKIEGLVLGAKKDFPRAGGIELKKIEKVIEENFLTIQQIELAEFISDHYISPLGIVLKSFVPARVSSRSAKHEAQSTKKKNIILTKEQQKAISEITGNRKSKISNKKFLLFGPSGSGKTEVYIHSILKLREKDPDLQFLILLPEQTLTPQAIERYSPYFKTEEIAVLSSNISKGRFCSAWEKVRTGETKLIIATRKGVFAPYKKLGMIVIDEEQDMSFKQWDMNPRYDARTAAEKLAELHGCQIVLGTATPRIETYYRTTKKDLELLNLPPLEILNTKYQIPNTILVDMRKERWEKNYSCVSKKLKSEIAYALKYQQQTILFINRQGMSSFSVCENCKTVLKCPECDRALVYDTAGHYRCVHCAYKTSITPQCPKCGGLVFKNVGLGTQKVEKEVQNIFPGARVARIDSQVIRKSGTQEKTYADFSAGKIDILVGTQMITKGWDLPNVVLVGIIDTDNMLTQPDFRTSEKFYQNIVQIAGRAGRPGAKFPGTVIIQTFQPENKAIKTAAEKDFASFFAREAEERKALAYPPFGRIVKLIFQDYGTKKTESEAKRAHEILKKVPSVSNTEPEDAFVPKVRGRYRKQLVIKFKGEMPPELKKELRKLGPGWIIDVDPVLIV